MTFKVFTPIEPVEPSTVIRFISGSLSLCYPKPFGFGMGFKGKKQHVLAFRQSITS
jgi:hypothetical protein